MIEIFDEVLLRVLNYTPKLHWNKSVGAAGMK